MSIETIQAPLQKEKLLARVLATPALGPLAALILAGIIFSLTTSTFLSVENFSLILQQSLVIGVLALGQTLIILTGGIDLSNGALAVAGTIVIAKFVSGGGNPVVALFLGLAVCIAIGTLVGLLVSRVRLPPFIVTLGALTVVQASTRLFSESRSYSVTSDLVGGLGDGFQLGLATVTYGTILWILLYALLWYILSQTAWGRHVYAVGNNEEAARLTGVNVRRIVLSVYMTASVLYAFGAWEALGRIPNADANAYQTANLDSITAVVIGGTSLFGGRGGVMGTLIGTLIVGVLRNGLTQARIDALYQDVATGFLVIGAVALDQVSRRRHP